MFYFLFNRTQNTGVILQPTLKAITQNYTYEVLEPSYVLFNVTSNGSNGHIYYWNVLKNDWKMWVRVLVNFEEHDGRFVTFTNKTVNFCKLLSSSRYEPLIKIFYEALLDISPTIVRRCPIQKVGVRVGFKMLQGNQKKMFRSFQQKLYYMPILKFETDKVPPIWPETKIYVKIEYLSKENGHLKDILRLSVNAEIMKK